MTTHYRLTEEERHAAFLDAQYRAYVAAQDADSAEMSVGQHRVTLDNTVQIERHRARTWAAVADALRKDHA